PGASLPVRIVDLRSIADAEHVARRLIVRDARRPFDLTRGPVMRVSILQMSSEERILLLTMHHVVNDAWSRTILVREVSELYAARVEGRQAALPPLPLQYADYAIWQRGWLREAALDAQLTFWRKPLEQEPVRE